MQAFLTPWNIGGGVAGLVFSVTALISLVSHRRKVGLALKKAGTSLFSQAGFFTLVILVFMLISVLESGQFFNANITHGAIFGLLGYALALGFDLVSVVCMLARLNAQRMRDEQGSRLNLVGVIVCALVSAFANCAGSLQGYTPSDLSHTPLWMRVSAPWLSMVFPTLIVVLSMTTDHILDHAPARGIDVATYRERERKRVDLVQVRLDTERELLRLETELATLRREREQASGQVRREWAIWSWLRPVVPVSPNVTGEALKDGIDQAMQTLRAALEERFEGLDARLSTLDTQVGTWATETGRHLSTLDTHVGHLQGQMDTDGTGAQEDQGTPTGQKGQGSGHRRTSEKQHGTDQQDQGHAADLILTAFRRLGVSTPDTWIAREVGCSRKTVGRWKKRFLEQGLLSAPVDREQLEPASTASEAAEQARR